MSQIILDGVGLTFRVRGTCSMSLKEYVVKQMFRRSVNPILEVRALSGLNLTVRQGDRVGVIGHNGAGKSTLLRAAGRHLSADDGPPDGRGPHQRLCSTSPSASSGMRPAGKTSPTAAISRARRRARCRPRRNTIAEFSELGEFLNMPVRYYSAGMMVRLAFSIATSIDPEILLVDEVLSVGDMSLSGEGPRADAQMMDRAHLMVMVSHDLVSLAKICNRAVWLDHGHMMKEGPTDEVIAAYTAAATAGQVKVAA